MGGRAGIASSFSTDAVGHRQETQARLSGALWLRQPAGPPIPSVKWIDAQALDRIGLVVPNRRKAKIFDPVNLHPASNAEGSINREDLARRSRDDFRLKPAMVGAETGMKLPDEIGGYTAEIANQNLLKLNVANRTAHRRARAYSVSRGKCLTAHSTSKTPSHQQLRNDLHVKMNAHPRYW